MWQCSSVPGTSQEQMTHESPSRESMAVAKAVVKEAVEMEWE